MDLGLLSLHIWAARPKISLHCGMLKIMRAIAAVNRDTRMTIGYVNALIMSLMALLMVFSGIKSRSGPFFWGGLLIIVFYAEKLLGLSFGSLSIYIRVLDVLGLIVCAAIFVLRRSRLKIK